SQGIEARTDVKMTGPKDAQTVVVDDIPDVIQKSMQARDEYVQRVPPEKQHPDDKGILPADNYAYYTANQYYLYGHFKEAKDRFQVLFEQNCRKKWIGYAAWIRLLDMALKENNGPRANELAVFDQDPNKTCAVEGVVNSEEMSEHTGKKFTGDVIVN